MIAVESIIKKYLVSQATTSLPQGLLYRNPRTLCLVSKFERLCMVSLLKKKKNTYCGLLNFKTRPSCGALFFNILD